MKKYIPYEKMSKKQRAEIDKARRAGWGEISPVTRCRRDETIYNRKKRRNGWDDHDTGAFVYGFG